MFIPFVAKRRCADCRAPKSRKASVQAPDIPGHCLCVATPIATPVGSSVFTLLGRLPSPCGGLRGDVCRADACSTLTRAAPAPERLGTGSGLLGPGLAQTSLRLCSTAQQRRGHQAEVPSFPDALHLKVYCAVNIQNHFCTISTKPLLK